MAAAKRFSTEQIVAKLREAEKLQAQGLSIPAVPLGSDGDVVSVAVTITLCAVL